MKTAMVNVSGKAITDALNDHKKTARQVFIKMGRSEAYLSGIIRYGRLPKSMLPVLAEALETPVARLLDQGEPAKTPQSAVKRYHAEMEVSSNRLHMTLYFGDQELYNTYSKIKGNTELDLMQAISYAAHWMYKLVEQEVLRKQE